MSMKGLFLLAEAAELEVEESVKENSTIPLETDEEMQEGHSKTFNRKVNLKDGKAVLPLEQKEWQSWASWSVEEQAKGMEETHTDFFEMYEETQIHHKQNQPPGTTELQEEHTHRTKRAELLAQTAEQNLLQKSSEIGEEMTEEAKIIFLLNSWAEMQMPLEASDVPERSTAEKEIDQYYAEIQQRNMEEANKTVLDTIEKQLSPPTYQYSILGDQPRILMEQPWIPKARKWLRGERAKQGEPQNPLLMASEPGLNVRGWLRTVYTKEEELILESERKMDLATAAIRKQYAEIQSKISPAKTATQKIRWTPNLPIPPPDGPDTLNVPPEIRTQEGFSSSPPRVSKEQLKKRKREEKKREMDEKAMDEALDTEVLPKKKRGKKLNEFEEAMRVAGMCPENPYGTTEKKGKGRGDGGKEERPWEERGRRGKGKRGPSGM
ncbi:hypothetical protein VE02_05159 [Pseudogymnoascus sp. 03VT05]|nr:hypothetical protein VE02_05159 [Pseudogymnoascus sp. 03VT05]